MNCHFCGFRDMDDEHCPLCGTVVDFDVTRASKHPDQFPLVLCCLEKNLPPARPITDLAKSTISRGKGEKKQIYFLFDLSEPTPFLAAVDHIRDVDGWELIIDGKLRPYSRELWLPFIYLFQGSPQ